MPSAAAVYSLASVAPVIQRIVAGATPLELVSGVVIVGISADWISVHIELNFGIDILSIKVADVAAFVVVTVV